MRILINASNLRVGGGIQVADSICRELYKYPQHSFTVVHPNALRACSKVIIQYDNVETVEYEIPFGIKVIITGRDKTLDALVSKKKIDVVLTIFGPSRWKPKVPHLSGFAKPQLVLPESPFWRILSFKQRVGYRAKNFMTKYSFKKCADNYFTENPFISKRLQELFPYKKIYTITNNANQVFMHPDLWKKDVELPPFRGITLLTVSANYPHKNLHIIIPVCHYLEKRYPSLSFRFVLTIQEDDLQGIDECVRKHLIFLGPVKIEQVPYLYEQCNIMFLPTLLECFSASYAEAMVMRKPILTTDLNFARGLCGNAAQYFEATSIESLGNCIYKMANDKNLRERLVEYGTLQLQKFDTFEQRADKLIRLTEKVAIRYLQK